VGGPKAIFYQLERTLNTEIIRSNFRFQFLLVPLDLLILHIFLSHSVNCLYFFFHDFQVTMTLAETSLLYVIELHKKEHFTYVFLTKKNRNNQ
jgi:hypothetical protein